MLTFYTFGSRGYFRERLYLHLPFTALNHSPLCKSLRTFNLYESLCTFVLLTAHSNGIRPGFRSRRRVFPPEIRLQEASRILQILSHEPAFSIFDFSSRFDFVGPTQFLSVGWLQVFLALSCFLQGRNEMRWEKTREIGSPSGMLTPALN